jgi:hypothetical protein
MNKNDTNIISDEDFLKEILNEHKPTPIVETPSDIDDILNSGEEAITPVKETSEISEANEDSEESKPSSKKEDEVIQEERSGLRRFGVKDTISSLIENETWIDMPILYDGKEYNNITDLIEKEKPSKELFELLSIAQKDYRQKQIDEQYVKIGDKDSTKAKLVNAILHDVDYTDLLEYNKEVVEPLQKIDFTTLKDGDRIAEAFVKQCLIEIDGYHPESIDVVVEKLKKDFRLLEKAEEYQKVTIENFNREIEKREFEKKENLKLAEEDLKKEVKALKDELKTSNIDNKFANEMIKLRYTKDEKGKYHYENMIKDKLKDKSFEVKLLHFLLNEEDFLNTQKSKTKLETSKKFLELVNISPKEKGSKESKNPGNLQTDDEDFLADLGLI